ncbi:hypothetical protein CC1G_15516 [Coprinopsis cinerea okayama7|uniref:Uncharacterized protein n=1 Tax=Coprinopsis cinerea (strain Okayama-7 / 130 / ATCC MYA-4618 / FGSC 9003) TaxID=240176 RepID=D6RN97_COPC7|nr:hypothetical protein CC1G_15516 [Coprinopsis cinerea okayama7\|eukprot:XP_002910975.1 hypothetical protein CC1G_15516 [Coprinopsis cinerea okayama7\
MFETFHNSLSLQKLTVNVSGLGASLHWSDVLSIQKFSILRLRRLTLLVNYKHSAMTATQIQYFDIKFRFGTSRL